ncbi:hypothetical protein DL96DRAFT_1581059 [Flagelloscypha sp. PMI_526]|nr:hypothetical protein DL96DRAFT_1581059 [Flagelloscypha sp. PMI_526]
MSWEETPALPSVRLLSFEMFGKPDFEDGTSLARYMQLEDNKIEYLEFKENFSPNTFPVSLSFLEPFATLRQHLLHLSFGPRLHRTIVTRDGKYGTLPLGMFPQLQTVQFAISALRDKTNTDTWTPWSNWLASMLTSENDWIHSLKILRLLMEPDLVQRPTTTLDRLSGSMNIQIHVCVDGNGNNADLFEHTVVSVRSSLPAWDEANKLKCWMRLGE